MAGNVLHMGKNVMTVEEDIRSLFLQKKDWQ